MPVALARSASLVLLVALAGACSQGASGSTFGFPPGPTPTGQATTGADTGSTGEPDGGECCLANGTPGCNDGAIEACVCADLGSCCAEEWTPACAAAVDQLGCGQCGGGELTGDVDPDDSGGGGTQDCCVAGVGPGCNDATIQACVCAEVPFCCDDAWGEVCTDAVEAFGCGHCGGAEETGDPTTGSGGDTGEPPPPPPPSNDCCTPAANPGCTEVAVQDCVCTTDPFCCDSEWDQVCVDQVDSFGCGDCGGGMPPGPTCCAAQPGPGCGDPLAELCVCLVDSYCCDTQWDDSCAILADLLMCISC